MRRLTDTDGLTEFQRDILRTVRDFVDAEVLPVASELDALTRCPRAGFLGEAPARSRRTFGKIIGEHQAISFKLASDTSGCTGTRRCC